tara:strand:+ start:1781 stop:2143 length:363 start_codon:yes stop_codon:yes gene_type:complete
MKEYEEIKNDIQLRIARSSMANITEAIREIDMYIHVNCTKQNIKYRVQKQLGDIQTEVLFNDVVSTHFADVDRRPEGLCDLWYLVSYRADLVWKYRAVYSRFKICMDNIKKNNKNNKEIA